MHLRKLVARCLIVLEGRPAKEPYCTLVKACYEASLYLSHSPLKSLTALESRPAKIIVLISRPAKMPYCARVKVCSPASALATYKTIH